jgi:hypothetical protein
MVVFLGAWSDERIVNVPFLIPCHIAAWSAGSSRKGGEQTHFAPAANAVSRRDERFGVVATESLQLAIKALFSYAICQKEKVVRACLAIHW